MSGAHSADSHALGGAGDRDGGASGGKKPLAARKANYKKTLSTAEKGRDRRSAAVRLRREKRAGRMMSKRLRVAPVDAVGEGEPRSAAVDLDAINAAVSLLDAGSAPSSEKVAAAKVVRHALSRPDEERPTDAVIGMGAIPVLIRLLGEVDIPELRLEAAWCLTNIAGGSDAHTRAVVPAAEHLVAMLDPSAAAAPLAEQAAWALSNIAADSLEFRELLTHNGAVAPLVELLGCKVPEVVATAAWCISNMLKGPSMSAGPWMDAGILPHLVRHLKADAPESVVTETSWILAYLTAREFEVIPAVLDTPIPAGLVAVIRSGAGEAARACVRVCGNLLGVNEECSDRVLAEPGLLDTLVALLGEGSERVLVHEVLWALANVASGTVEHATALLDAGALPAVLHHLTESPFHIQKEAAFVICNLAFQADGAAFLSTIMANSVLPSFLRFVRAPDMALADVSLRFVELVLHKFPRGPETVEEAGGIEALDDVAERSPNRAMAAHAHALVDKFFGEDYHAEEDLAAEAAAPHPEAPIAFGRGRGRAAVLPAWMTKASDGGAPPPGLPPPAHGSVPGYSSAGGDAHDAAPADGGAQPNLFSFGFRGNTSSGGSQ